MFRGHSSFAVQFDKQFLTTGAGVAVPSLEGRPTLSMSYTVPSFVLRFTNPLMSVFNPASMYNLHIT